jgi:D-aminopeptidase
LVRIGPRKLRARDLGIPFDGTPGKYNAITDVKDIEVGFSTIIQGDSVRTGVTAIFPRGTDFTTYQPPCFANWFSLNGNGEMTGIHLLTESGSLRGPILITNTNDVGICRNSLIKWFLMKNESTTMINIEENDIPIIAETWDGYLNDIYGSHVKEEHVFEALNNAKGSDPFVPEGNVGGGTGMICFGYKGGTGTSSRIVEGLNYTLGVLVQTNFGRTKQLVVAGVPVGQELLQMETNPYNSTKDAGSIIVILATDAPLLPHQLKRLATRVSLGVGKLGGIGADSSGDIFLAFSTASVSDATATTKSAIFLSNNQMNPLFEATIQCTEEAIINAMIAAETMTGYRGHIIEAISHQNLIEILRKYNRFQGTNKNGAQRVYFLPCYQIIILFTFYYYLFTALA